MKAEEAKRKRKELAQLREKKYKGLKQDDLPAESTDKGDLFKDTKKKKTSTKKKAQTKV